MAWMTGGSSSVTSVSPSLRRRLFLFLASSSSSPEPSRPASPLTSPSLATLAVSCFSCFLASASACFFSFSSCLSAALRDFSSAFRTASASSTLALCKAWTFPVHDSTSFVKQSAIRFNNSIAFFWVSIIVSMRWTDGCLNKQCDKIITVDNNWQLTMIHFIYDQCQWQWWCWLQLHSNVFLRTRHRSSVTLRQWRTAGSVWHASSSAKIEALQSLKYGSSKQSWKSLRLASTWEPNALDSSNAVVTSSRRDRRRLSVVSDFSPSVPRTFGAVTSRTFSAIFLERCNSRSASCRSLVVLARCFDA